MEQDEEVRVEEKEEEEMVVVEEEEVHCGEDVEDRMFKTRNVTTESSI